MKGNNKAGSAAALILISLLILSFIGGVSAQEKKEALKGKTVNINKATAEELATVPLMTPELAKKIVKYREDTGDFQVIEELLQVEGFTRTLLDRIRTFLILEGLGGDECTC